MDKPCLLVVTGRPGSGKTTFAKAFGDAIYMPIISRDQIKEGYVRTFGKGHSHLPQESNRITTEIFFETLYGLMTNDVSVIAEAAFQHGVWSHMLERFMEKVRIYVLICKVDDKTAMDRCIRRGLANPLREYYHGDIVVDMARKGIVPAISPYEEPHLDVPTFHIDTLSGYNPSIKELEKAIFQQEI